MEGDVISAQEIFRFRRQGVAGDGTVVGRFEATGVRPTFVDRLKVAGVELPSQPVRRALIMQGLVLLLVFFGTAMLVLGSYAFANRRRLAAAASLRQRVGDNAPVVIQANILRDRAAQQRSRDRQAARDDVGCVGGRVRAATSWGRMDCWRVSARQRGDGFVADAAGPAIRRRHGRHGCVARRVCAVRRPSHRCASDA